MSSYHGGWGYIVYGLQEKYYMWVGVDLLSNVSEPPLSGKYKIIVKSKSGHQESIIYHFKPLKKDPIHGYPTNIKYNHQNKTLAWGPTSGQTGYNILIFKGDKPLSSNNAENMVYTSHEVLITKNSFKIPDNIRFESGASYYIFVESYYSPDNKYYKASYIHRQDKNDQIAVFKVL